MSRNNYSIYTALIFVVLSTVVSVMLVHGFVSYQVAKNQVLDRAREQTSTTLNSLKKSLAVFIQAYAVNEYETIVLHEIENSDFFAIIVSDKKMGEILGQDAYVSGNVKYADGRIAEYDPDDAQQAQALSQCFYEDSTKIEGEFGEVLGSIRVCTSPYAVEQAREDFLRDNLINTVAITLTLIILLIFFTHRIVLKPLSAIAQSVMQSDETGLPQTGVKEQGPREIRALASSINAMFEDIKRSRRALEEDINRRIEMQRQVENIRLYLQNVIDSMPSILVGIDSNRRITHWNKEAQSFTGTPPEQALNADVFRELPFLEVLSERITEAINQNKPVSLEHHSYRDETGALRYLDIMVYPLTSGDRRGAVIRIDDATASMRLQAMVMQNEKMLSVGGLAAGMAHEINNPLSGVLQGVQNVRRRLSEKLPANLKAAEDAGVDFENLQKYLKKRRIDEFFSAISDSGQRASDIVINMLGFSRTSNMEREATDLPELIEGALSLAALDYDLKKHYDFKNISVVREFEEDMPLVPCVKSEIQQVLFNLLTNAAHAFQAEDGQTPNPSITVRVRQDGSMALIEVEDNGPGMPEEVLSRAFEPFFTTKPPGKGTGLGLSVSYFIIHDEHHGRLEAESTPGEGTVFRIWLPLSKEATQ